MIRLLFDRTISSFNVILFYCIIKLGIFFYSLSQLKTNKDSCKDFRFNILYQFLNFNVHLSKYLNIVYGISPEANWLPDIYLYNEYVKWFLFLSFPPEWSLGRYLTCEIGKKSFTCRIMVVYYLHYDYVIYYYI